jgi:uncharacterized membrane protein YqjE
VSVTPPRHDEDPRDQSIGELLKQLSEQTSTLVRQELELARAELTQQGKKAGTGLGLFGGAGLLGLGAFGALTATLILLLDTFMKAWLAALIVTVVYAAIAAVLALRGKTEIKQATPPVPQTIETVKEDAQWAKTRK